MATRPPKRTRTRPSRPLALLLLILVALSGLVIWQGWKPRQGLDLVGGTSVILTPKGGTPSAGALTSAVDIIRRRVNGTGVTSAEVVTEGENVRVSLPNVGRAEALDIVGETAELTFRPVLEALNPTPGVNEPTPPATPSATATPKSSATPKSTRKPSPSASATTRPRAVPGALLPAQPSPSPTASPTKKASPTPSASASPAPPAAGSVPVEEALATFDCADRTVREKVSDLYGDPSMNTKEIVSCEEDGSVKYRLGPAEMTGKEIKSALATLRTDANGVSTGEWMVELTMKDARKWGELTKKYTGQQLAIVLDGITVSAPTIEQEIPNGIAQITGNFEQKSANRLANVLKYGSLPVQFEQSQTQTISATLGNRSLEGALLAGLLGLVAVLLYAVFYYRSLGLVTIVGMLLFASFNFLAIVVLGQSMGFTLTLAGIAGLIVSVGISADSYVVFYERLRDELRSGRSVQAGVERGFKRAFWTILTADGVSFLAAIVLYLISVGEVRGFAFTLGLATLIDVFIAWFYTRPVVTLLARTRMFREGRFGGFAGTRQLKEA